MPGSIPVPGALTVKPTEVTRIGEEAVLPYLRNRAGRKTCGFESHGLRSTNDNKVLCPSGEGTCLTNRGSTVRIRPGLLFNDRHQSVWSGRCLQNILSEFESRWCLWKNKTTRPIGPVWSGRHPVTVEITGSNPVWVARRCGTPTAERLVLGTSVCEFESRPHY